MGRRVFLFEEVIQIGRVSATRESRKLWPPGLPAASSGDCCRGEEGSQVGGVYLEPFVGLAVGTGRSRGLYRNRTGRQFLRNNHGKSLHAALRPVVDAGEDGVLMVEIVVEHGAEWSLERKILFEKARLCAVWIRYFRGRARARALHLQCDLGDAIGEQNVRPICFFRL